MADYYFFTDANAQASHPTDYLGVQSAAEAYGPVTPGSSGSDQYRVTSLHTASFNPTAYAACDGIVCVQRIPNTALVNIVLKPLVQPALNFTPVKYIVYKGILASSLINGAEVAAPGNNDLAKFVWIEQAKKNSIILPIAAPPAAALGIELTATAGPDLADTEPLDRLFFRTAVAFQLPKVTGGWSLGSFDKAGFGIEVLMEGLAFHHTLLQARRLENRITVTSLTGGETPAEVFDHWHEKEQVLGYVDPCAFYGSFFLTGIQAKSSTDTTFSPKAGNALYQDVLFPFANRKTAYLDIRNERNGSLNYFKNYGKSIQISYDPVTVAPAATDYYAGKWPILTLPAASFPATNTTKARNPFRIQLPVGDNPAPLVYVSQGYRDINSKGDGFPAELSSAERFYDAFALPAGGFTATKGSAGLNSLTLVVPNVTGGAATTPVSCYIRLKYLKQEQAATTVPTVVASANYLDNLFDPLNLPVLFKGNAAVKTAVYDEEIYVSAQSVPGLNFDFVGKIGIARDPDNTSFYVIPTTMRAQMGQASALIALSDETWTPPASYPSVIASKYEEVRIKQSELTLSANQSVPVAEFVVDSPAARTGVATPDFDKLLVIVVANAAYDSWKAKATAFDSRFRTWLGVTNLQPGTDLAGVDYTSFELVLRGYAFNAATNNYAVATVNTDPLDSVSNVTLFVKNEPASSGPAAADAVIIVPKRISYVVVLDRQGFAPASGGGSAGEDPATHPILEFEIKGPPNYRVDVQVSRDTPQLLTGAPGLAGAWDKSQPPEVRMTQLAFSSWTNGKQDLVLDAAGNATYPMPPDWWRDLARLPLHEFGTVNIRYRAVAWPSTSVTPSAWSTPDGAIAPKVVVRSNLVAFEVVESGTLNVDSAGVITPVKCGYDDTIATKRALMKFAVREANTLGMYTLVQWKRGFGKQWPQPPEFALVTDYGIVHLQNQPDWTIDQVRTDPRYVDAVDEATGDGFVISADKKTAVTNDNPGGPVAGAAVTHFFYTFDFDMRIHLNFEVPASVTIVKQEGIVLQDSQGTIYELVQGEIAPPLPFIIDRGTWKARILQVRGTGGAFTVSHPETYTGPK